MTDVGRRAFHVMLLAQETRGATALRFYQNVVVWADDVTGAKERVTALLAKQGALIISFEDDETYESDPTRVAYEKSIPEKGVVGISGRIYIAPEQSLFARLRDALAGRFGRR